MATVSNENANGVFLDIVHEAFFTFIPFYSTRISVILILLIRKLRLSLRLYPRNFQIIKGIMRSVLVLYLTYYYYRYSALGPVWAETRAQSVDWYSSGTLHPGKVLRGSLPLLSPAFKRSHFRHQVSPRPSRRERS